MKVLWFSATPIQTGIKALGLSSSFHGGGWIESLLKALPLKEHDIQLEVVFLMWGLDTVRSAADRENDGISYVAVPCKDPYLQKVDAQMEADFRQVYENFRPDIVHLFGTETQNTNTWLRLAGSEKCLISLTGIISKYIYHDMGGIQSELKKSVTLRDVLKGSAMVNHRKLEKRAHIERDTLRRAKYVTGRTTWDKAVSWLENPALQYYFCNENLRDAFYFHHWSLDTCEKYTIFSSSSASALKGAHQLLKAMPLILERYPRTQLFLTGSDPRTADNLITRMKRTGYQKYLNKLIKRLQIGHAVHFTGSLDEQQMAKQFAKAHVYVLPSNIENSPNSLCEAMLIGVPAVAANVGGVSDLLRHGEEGFLYPFEEHYMLAYWVIQIFSNDTLAASVSDAARARAVIRHDRIKNGEQMLRIYEQILAQEREHG